MTRVAQICDMYSIYLLTSVLIASSPPLSHQCTPELRRSGSLISSDLTPVAFRDSTNTPRCVAQVKLNLISILVQDCHCAPSPRGVPIIGRILWRKSKSPKQNAVHEQLLRQPEMLKSRQPELLITTDANDDRSPQLKKLSTFSYWSPYFRISRLSSSALKKSFEFLSLLKLVLPFIFCYPLQRLYPRFQDT
jgi:hypothetical protein